MTLKEFVSHLVGQAIGVLGWSEEETFNSDINVILLGVEAKWQMLKACHGLQDKQEQKPADKQDILQYARAHNLARKKK